jgi:glycosyltransferase involved in cell wall biosynthesis
MADLKVVAVTGSGAVGWHPLSRNTWSGSSHAFFSLIDERGALQRAFGVDAPPLYKWALMLKNVHPDRQRWRKQFYTDPVYRDALTRAVQRQLSPDDFEHEIVQIGAMFSTPEAVGGRARCYTYMDSNIAVSMRSPYAPRGLAPRRIAQILKYEERTYRAMTRIFTAGYYLRDSLVEDFGVPAERVSVLGMGVNLPYLPEPDPAKDFDRQEILFLGSDFRRKGGLALLQAFRVVRARFPKAKLHIVGPAELKIEPSLAAGVEWHGPLLKTRPAEWSRLERLFWGCSVSALPSLYEPFGIAPLEAMLYEIPCLATNIQALREFVIPGETGDVVPPGNVEALAEALARLLADPSGLSRMGRNARRMVLERYTWPPIVDRFLSILADERK